MTPSNAAKTVMIEAVEPPVFDRLLPIADPEGLPGQEFLDDVRKILGSKQLTNGPYVRQFEEAAAAYLHVTHCVAVSSCTAGLLLTLRALDLEGEVVLPSFTFHATAHAVAWNVLKPVFADCDTKTFCIDANAVETQIGPNTAAIVATHIFGCPAPVQQLREIADRCEIPVVFDAAHAFGSRTSTGKCIGAFGTAEVFSFTPTKLVVGGEGGLITTCDSGLAEKLRAARNYGDAGTYDPEILGLNARMSELHAALALRGIETLDARVAWRNALRRRYENNLRDVPGICFQQVPEGALSTVKDFSIVVDTQEYGHTRDWLAEELRRNNIDTRKYFYPPVHQQKLYAHFWDGRPLPATERVANSILALPIYSSLSERCVDKICDVIRSASPSGASK